MKNLFVPYEIALKLKDKGYEDNVGLAFYQDGELKLSEAYGNHIKAPLWQQAIEWFEQHHGIYIHVQFQRLSPVIYWEYNINKYNEDDKHGFDHVTTDYDFKDKVTALVSATEKALELI